MIEHKTMKCADINHAVRVLLKLKNESMPLREACRIYNIIEKLYPIYRACSEKEIALIKAHGGVFQNGNISFPDKKAAEEFQNECASIYGADMDIDVEEIVLKIETLDGILISPAEIAWLRGIIRFE